MKNRPSVNLESIDTLFGIDGTDGTVEVAISDIKGFKDHPFLVLDDENMENLVESVREFGVLTPVMLRESADGNYEMISGHRRMHAATIVGLEKLPAIIKELTDDEAVCLMVDSNIQREKLLPSEKAFAYKMKLEAMKRQSGRPSKENVCHSGTYYCRWKSALYNVNNKKHEYKFSARYVS